MRILKPNTLYSCRKQEKGFYTIEPMCECPSGLAAEPYFLASSNVFHPAVRIHIDAAVYLSLTTVRFEFDHGEAGGLPGGFRKTAKRRQEASLAKSSRGGIVHGHTNKSHCCSRATSNMVPCTPRVLGSTRMLKEEAFTPMDHQITRIQHVTREIRLAMPAGHFPYLCKGLEHQS